jgi:hypothetical protein
VLNILAELCKQTVAAELVRLRLTTMADHNAVGTGATSADRGEADPQGSDGFRQQGRTLRVKDRRYPLFGASARVRV